MGAFPRQWKRKIPRGKDKAFLEVRGRTGRAARGGRGREAEAKRFGERSDVRAKEGGKMKKRTGFVWVIHFLIGEFGFGVFLLLLIVQQRTEDDDFKPSKPSKNPPVVDLLKEKKAPKELPPLLGSGEKFGPSVLRPSSYPAGCNDPHPTTSNKITVPLFRRSRGPKSQKNRGKRLPFSSPPSSLNFPFWGSCIGTASCSPKSSGRRSLEGGWPFWVSGGRIRRNFSGSPVSAGRERAKLLGNPVFLKGWWGEKQFGEGNIIGRAFDTPKGANRGGVQ
ncbi:hypothetical protein GWK47_035869 [Chionoecetes opilio]|uniref:Uncharacterized protein n=1 Tax=Chionoecetes opilio TaxID=41210 RepID=A0A8J5CNB2_CHIOP|nr:hypothetical protein GWK47_035869 [Chionoecetes opilio]